MEIYQRPNELERGRFLDCEPDKGCSGLGSRIQVENLRQKWLRSRSPSRTGALVLLLKLLICSPFCFL